MIAQTPCAFCNRAIPADARACPYCLKPVSASADHLHDTILAKPDALKMNATTSAAVTLQETQELLSTDVLVQIDASASTIISTSGILLGLNSGAIFAGKVQGIALLFAIIYASPIVFLLLTIITATQVFYASGYLAQTDKTLLQRKIQRLRSSAILLTISILLIAISVCVYLTRPAAH